MTTSRATPCAFKDLCIDANDTAVVADFWSRALGLRAEAVGTDFVLRGALPEHTVWINGVPEAKTTKNRVHLDVHTASVQELVDLGASVLGDAHKWTDMADPEGGEFCAFLREPGQLPAYRLYELVVDSPDPERIARWWADQLGAEVQFSPEGWSWLEAARAMPWEMVFNKVPEPKTGKNRVHWDVVGDTAALVTAGATLQRARGGDISWDVLIDPDGNEFCVFAPEN